jgi:hypothetical protein
MAGFVVAFFVPHNDGTEKGIIDGPGFHSGATLVDLYEVDAEIASFETREEAEAWLDKVESGGSAFTGDHDDDAEGKDD